MSPLLIGLLVAGGVIAAMVAFRIISSRREEEKIKAERKAIDDSLTGIHTMTGYSRNSQRAKATVTPLPASKTTKAAQKRVEPSLDKTPDDLMLFSNTYASTTPTYTEDDTRKYAGGGGTFDGGGASGNWSPAPSQSCDTESSRASSYDSSPSSCDSGSSSSDSGSSGSSD